MSPRPFGADPPAPKPGWERLAESWGAWNIPGQLPTASDVAREAVWIVAYRTEHPDRDGELRAWGDLLSLRPVDLLYLEAMAGAGFEDLARQVVGLPRDPGRATAQWRALSSADRERVAHLVVRTAAAMMERADRVRTDAERAEAKAQTEAAIRAHLAGMGDSAVGTTGGFHEARRLIDARENSVWVQVATVFGVLIAGGIVVNGLVRAATGGGS